MPEERAARIVKRLLSPNSSWEQFERVLTSYKRLDWNQAVAFVADEIREAIQESRRGHPLGRDACKELAAEASILGRRLQDRADARQAEEDRLEAMRLYDQYGG